MEQKPTTEALTKREAAAVEYVPYGAQDKIKMTVAIVQNLIAVKTKTGKTCSERDALRFMAMCIAKRLNPFEGDCFLIGYDGKDSPSFSLVTAHQTYLKRAELHPEFDGMESGVIVLGEDGKLKDLPGDFYEEGQRVVGGWATVHFKTRKYPMNKRLRMSTFNKGFGQWNDNGNGMIVKCAEADALRSSFPTMLGGLYMREEMPDIAPQFAKPDFAATAKPLFGSTVDVPPAEPTPEKEPDDGDLGPQKPEPAGQDFPSQPEEKPVSGFNPLKALRGLMAMASPKVKESDLLDFWASTGITDGSYGSMEEVAMSKGTEWMVQQTESWPATAAQVAAAKAKAKA